MGETDLEKLIAMLKDLLRGGGGGQKIDGPSAESVFSAGSGMAKGVFSAGASGATGVLSTFGTIFMSPLGIIILFVIIFYFGCSWEWPKKIPGIGTGIELFCDSGGLEGAWNAFKRGISVLTDLMEDVLDEEEAVYADGIQAAPPPNKDRYNWELSSIAEGGRHPVPVDETTPDCMEITNQGNLEDNRFFKKKCYLRTTTDNEWDLILSRTVENKDENRYEAGQEPILYIDNAEEGAGGQQQVPYEVQQHYQTRLRRKEKAVYNGILIDKCNLLEDSECPGKEGISTTLDDGNPTDCIWRAGLHGESRGEGCRQNNAECDVSDEEPCEKLTGGTNKEYKCTREVPGAPTTEGSAQRGRGECIRIPTYVLNPEMGGDYNLGDTCINGPDWGEASGEELTRLNHLSHDPVRPGGLTYFINDTSQSPTNMDPLNCSLGSGPEPCSPSGSAAESQANLCIYNMDIVGGTDSIDEYYQGCGADIENENGSSGLQSFSTNPCNINTIKHIVYSDNIIVDPTTAYQEIKEPEDYTLDYFGSLWSTSDLDCTAEYSLYESIGIPPARFKVPYCYEFDSPLTNYDPNSDDINLELTPLYNLEGASEALHGSCHEKDISTCTGPNCEWIPATPGAVEGEAGGECKYKPQKICNEEINCKSLNSEECGGNALHNICKWQNEGMGEWIDTGCYESLEGDNLKMDEVDGVQHPIRGPDHCLHAGGHWIPEYCKNTESGEIIYGVDQDLCENGQQCIPKDCIPHSESHCSSIPLINDEYINFDCPDLGNNICTPPTHGWEPGNDFICNVSSSIAFKDRQCPEGYIGRPVNDNNLDSTTKCEFICNNPNISEIEFKCQGCDRSSSGSPDFDSLYERNKYITEDTDTRGEETCIKDVGTDNETIGQVGDSGICDFIPGQQETCDLAAGCVWKEHWWENISDILDNPQDGIKTCPGDYSCIHDGSGRHYLINIIINSGAFNTPPLRPGAYPVSLENKIDSLKGEFALRTPGLLLTTTIDGLSPQGKSGYISENMEERHSDMTLINDDPIMTNFHDEKWITNWLNLIQYVLHHGGTNAIQELGEWAKEALARSGTPPDFADAVADFDTADPSRKHQIEETINEALEMPNNICINTENLEDLVGSDLHSDLCFNATKEGREGYNDYDYWNFGILHPYLAGSSVSSEESIDVSVMKVDCERSNNSAGNLYNKDRGFSPIIQTLFHRNEIPFIKYGEKTCINKVKTERAEYDCKAEFKKNAAAKGRTPAGPVDCLFENKCKYIPEFNSNNIFKGEGETPYPHSQDININAYDGKCRTGNTPGKCWDYRDFIETLKCNEHAVTLDVSSADSTDRDSFCKELRYDLSKDTMINLRKFLNIKIDEHDNQNEDGDIDAWSTYLNRENGPDGQPYKPRSPSFLTLLDNIDNTGVPSDFGSIHPCANETAYIHFYNELNELRQGLAPESIVIDSNGDPQWTDNGATSLRKKELYKKAICRLNTGGHPRIQGEPKQHNPCRPLNESNLVTADPEPTDVYKNNIIASWVTAGDKVLSDSESLLRSKARLFSTNHYEDSANFYHRYTTVAGFDLMSEEDIKPFDISIYDTEDVITNGQDHDKIMQHYRLEHGNMLEQLCHYQLMYNNRGGGAENLESIKYGPITEQSIDMASSDKHHPAHYLCSSCRNPGNNYANRCGINGDNDVSYYCSGDESLGISGDKNICNDDGSCRCSILNSQDVGGIKQYYLDPNVDEYRKCVTTDDQTCGTSHNMEFKLIYTNDDENEALFTDSNKDRPLCNCRDGATGNSVRHFGVACDKFDGEGNLGAESGDLYGCNGQFSEYEFSFYGTNYKETEYINNKLDLTWEEQPRGAGNDGSLKEDNKILYRILSFLRNRTKTIYEEYQEIINSGSEIYCENSNSSLLCNLKEFWKNIQNRSKRIPPEGDPNYYLNFHNYPIHPSEDEETDFSTSIIDPDFVYTLKDILLELYENAWKYSPPDRSAPDEDKKRYIFLNHIGKDNSNRPPPDTEKGHRDRAWHILNEEIQSPDSLFYYYYRNTDSGPKICDCTRESDGLNTWDEDQINQNYQKMELNKIKEPPYSEYESVATLPGGEIKDGIHKELYQYIAKEDSAKWGYRCELETKCAERGGLAKPIYGSLGKSLPEKLGGEGNNKLFNADQWAYKTSSDNVVHSSRREGVQVYKPNEEIYYYEVDLLYPNMGRLLENAGTIQSWEDIKPSLDQGNAFNEADEMDTKNMETIVYSYHPNDSTDPEKRFDGGPKDLTECKYLKSTTDYGSNIPYTTLSCHEEEPENIIDHRRDRFRYENTAGEEVVARREKDLGQILAPTSWNKIGTLRDDLVGHCDDVDYNNRRDCEKNAGSRAWHTYDGIEETIEVPEMCHSKYPTTHPNHNEGCLEEGRYRSSDHMYECVHRGTEDSPCIYTHPVIGGERKEHRDNVIVDSGRLPEYLDPKGNNPLLCDCTFSLKSKEPNMPWGGAPDSNDSSEQGAESTESPSYGDYCEYPVNQRKTDEQGHAITHTEQTQTQVYDMYGEATNEMKSNQGICVPDNLKKMYIPGVGLTSISKNNDELKRARIAEGAGSAPSETNKIMVPPLWDNEEDPDNDTPSSGNCQAAADIKSDNSAWKNLYDPVVDNRSIAQLANAQEAQTDVSQAEKDRMLDYAITGLDRQSTDQAVQRIFANHLIDLNDPRIYSELINIEGVPDDGVISYMSGERGAPFLGDSAVLTDTEQSIREMVNETWGSFDAKDEFKIKGKSYKWKCLNQKESDTCDDPTGEDCICKAEVCHCGPDQEMTPLDLNNPCGDCVARLEGSQAMKDDIRSHCVNDKPNYITSPINYKPGPGLISTRPHSDLFRKDKTSLDGSRIEPHERTQEIINEFESEIPGRSAKLYEEYDNRNIFRLSNFKSDWCNCKAGYLNGEVGKGCALGDDANETECEHRGACETHVDPFDTNSGCAVCNCDNGIEDSSIESRNRDPTNACRTCKPGFYPDPTSPNLDYCIPQKSLSHIPFDSSRECTTTPTCTHTGCDQCEQDAGCINEIGAAMREKTSWDYQKYDEWRLWGGGDAFDKLEYANFGSALRSRANNLEGIPTTRNHYPPTQSADRLAWAMTNKGHEQGLETGCGELGKPSNFAFVNRVAGDWIDVLKNETTPRSTQALDTAWPVGGADATAIRENVTGGNTNPTSPGVYLLDLLAEKGDIRGLPNGPVADGTNIIWQGGDFARQVGESTAASNTAAPRAGDGWQPLGDFGDDPVPMSRQCYCGGPYNR